MDHILTDDFSNIILDMATASINQKKYKVIVGVSKPDVMGTILNLNGNDKIRKGSVDLKWNKVEIGKFINGSCFKDWGTDDLECLHNLAEKAPYPGFLHYCASTFPEGFKHVESKEAAKTKEHTYENRIESFVIRNE